MKDRLKDHELGILLHNLWDRQQSYNKDLESVCTDRNNPTRWTEVLLLGLISEANEVLREIGWKRHRGTKTFHKIPRDNLAYELSDLTKYCLSLWQVWGFSLEDVLKHTSQKGIIMEQRLRQEFYPLPPIGAKVLVVDLDQTIANLRYGLWEYAVRIAAIEWNTPYTLITRNADVDLGIPYKEFQELKAQFIEQGGYSQLPVMTPEWQSVVQAIKDNVYVIAVTARPAEKYPRLWLETWEWLRLHNLPVNQLHIGSDVRIQLVTDLAAKTYDTVLFDDDPDLVERALASGIKVVLTRSPYNAHLWHRKGVTLATPGIQIKFPFEEGGGRTEGQEEASSVSSGNRR